MGETLNIAVLGAGTWGTGLSDLLAHKNYSVSVWTPFEEEARELQSTRMCRNLPGITLPDTIEYCTDMEQAAAGKDLVLVVTPSIHVRSTARLAAPFVRQAQIVACASKGLEAHTLMTMTDIIGVEMADKKPRLVALSGPTHAEEVIRHLPSAIVSASTDYEAACFVQKTFSTDYMRVYTSSDPHGVEVCAATKNVIALASGIISGLGCGDNTRAALITRGLVEMKRLGRAVGCQEETFNGLAGIGDLIVTCTSEHSRNNRAGKLIGQGKTAQEACEEVGMVVEGLSALAACVALRDSLEINMPIVSAVDDVVAGRISAEEALATLYARDLTQE